MPKTLPSGVPASSPWGAVESGEVVAPGIVLVSTSGHGGYILSPERQLQMPPQLRQSWSGTPGAYEEDTDWAQVAVRWPQYFEPRAVHAAVQTITHGGDWMEKPRAWLGTDAGQPARDRAASYQPTPPQADLFG